MLKVKEYCTIENQKVSENVQDWLVRKYHDIFSTLDVNNCEGDVFTNIILYLNREVKKLKEFEDPELIKTFLKNFFEIIIREDITTRQYWVEYLDIHMEERYVEDGETLYEYESDYWAPLAVRGPKDEVECFIKKLLSAIDAEFKFEDLDLDLSELEDEFESDDYEEKGGSIDRAYYEQRSFNYSL